MKWGKRSFSTKDMLGDLVMHWWMTRQNTTLQDLTRRGMKLAAFVLVVIAMTHVLYPTQKEGWLLWLGQEHATLAHWTAVVLVAFNAMILSLVRDAWKHGHKFLAAGGGLFTLCLMAVVLGGAWNYYSATSGKAVGASVAAIDGSTDRVTELRAAQTALEARAASSMAAVDKALAEAPANAPTGRSRLLAQRTAAEQSFAAERTRLASELKEARAASVTTQTSNFDPRPIDAAMAGVFGVERATMASSNDLLRSFTFELIAILGVALAMTAVLAKDESVAQPVSEASSEPLAATADPPEEEDDLGLPDLREEEFQASSAVSDNRNAARGRKAAQTRRKNEEDRQAPRGAGDTRLPPEETEVRTAEIEPEPEPEDEIETVEVSEPETKEAA